MQNLAPGWWLKRPKEEGSETQAMERLVGPVAYRGRNQHIQRKQGKAAKPLGRSKRSRGIMSTDLEEKEYLTIQYDLKSNLEPQEIMVQEGQS